MSPAMHNAAFEALGLNWRYVPLPVAPDQVEAAVRGLPALGFRGANVTVPHKQEVIPALDLITPDARALGAVNTIVVEWGEDGEAKLMGHNTDAAGFIGRLRDSDFVPAGKRAVVVGAGGAARAVVFGLMEAGADEIVVLNRTLERAEALVSELGRPSRSALRSSTLTPETLIEKARATDLLVQATPVGMWPRVDASIWPDDAPIPARLTVFDLVYNPLGTKLLRQARESGARPIDGLGMLVQQGALSFELWTAERPPVDLMRKACQRALRKSPPLCMAEDSAAESSAVDRQPVWLPGVIRAGPIVLGYIPIGLTFGVLAQQAGLSAFNALMMSLLVYAGSSQLIAVGLFAANAPLSSIILTTFVVNLRHILLSAAVAPFLKRWRNSELAAFAYQLTDETFAIHSAQFSSEVPDKGEVFATNVTAQAAWISGTWLGVTLGQFITDVKPLGLDYVLPAMFIALLVLQIKDRVQIGVALITGVLSVALFVAGVGRWNVIFATLLGATLGVIIDLWTNRRSS